MEQELNRTEMKPERYGNERSTDYYATSLHKKSQ